MNLMPVTVTVTVTIFIIIIIKIINSYLINNYFDFNYYHVYHHEFNLNSSLSNLDFFPYICIII